ncbi:MAG TPA: ankyrin repeat domain-containing protein [Terracidiphilus sp.]|jgi:ankyrin repeat protein
MPLKELPARPNLEQFKKQAKDLARDCRLEVPDAIARAHRHLPHFEKPSQSRVALTEAQLVIAREHGFESWPKFAAHIAALNLERALSAIADPVAAFIHAACVPRDDHDSGTLDEAEMIRSRYPHAANANICTAAILADESSVRAQLSRNPALATEPGGPHGWDALTHLCFSRYLRLDPSRSEAFVRTARALLEAGASANTGWWETIDQPHPRQILESAIYGAAGIAKHPGVTRLLLEYGADPNDEETPYHVPEGYDNTVMRILLESGKLTDMSRTWMLARKADWHDFDGMKLALEFGADPNATPRWGNSAFQHAIQRDNSLEMIRLLLDHGADPLLRNVHSGRSAAAMAARRGRGDVLELLAERGIDPQLGGVDRLIATCAMAQDAAIEAVFAADPQLRQEIVAEGGTLLAQFAGVGNVEGVRCLLALGVPPDALYPEGDGYFEIAKNSTALHVAAWRGWPATVKLLLERGAPVNALDGRGRTALQLAIRACVDSYWKRRRSPQWIEPLLQAGATLDGIEIPCGYDEADELLRAYAGKPTAGSD